MIKLLIEGDAVGKGRPRASTIGGKARLYTPKKTADYETRVKSLAHSAMLGRQIATDAIEAEIWVMVAPTASWAKKKQLAALEGDIYPTAKPDLDNVAKIVLDALNGIVYQDDKQVCDLVIRRRFAPKSAVLVYIRTTSKGDE